MDHALLRAKVTAYFRAHLEKGKQRRATLGPYNGEERGSIEQTLELLESGNSEYWHLFGSDYAQDELDKFFGSTALSPDDYRDHTPRVLDEIRKAKIGVFKTLLEYGQSLESPPFFPGACNPQSEPPYLYNSAGFAYL